MKVGFLGGLVLLILTIIFSYIAIQNNKIAKEITIKSFELNTPLKSISDNNISDKNISEKPIIKKSSKWDNFDKKFDNFDKKFEDF